MKYQIKDEPFTILVCKMNAGESLKCQSGAMAWMTPGISMETKAGGLGGAFKKALIGESLFLSTYTANSDGEIAFAKRLPGEILAFNIGETPLIAQKGSFLASTPNVQMDIYLQKKIGAGLVGGEGFIMQKFSGTGYVFLEIDGATEIKELAPGEKLVIDSGYIAAMDATCSMDIQMIKGFANVIGGGEGLFNTVVTGPGRVWLQTMPVSTLANAIARYLPPSN
ncbi:MAG: TIGR00266 family protein [Clostridiales bacterium]|nr:TIGR00266 family protein [Candidatus Crickella merdequi]